MRNTADTTVDGAKPPRTSEGTFDRGDGLHLYERIWVPEGTPRAAVVIVHGYAEHSGRYAHVARYLTRRRLAVHAFDLRGHGRSEGPRVLVRSFNEHLDDVERFLARVRMRSGTQPVFLLGHSMGALIATLLATTRRPLLDGMLLSGAALEFPNEQPRFVRKIATPLLLALARIAPGLRLSELAAGDVSRDPAVAADYDSDPLNYRGRVPLGLVGAMARALRHIEAHRGEITLPLLLMHGGEDKLADVRGSRALHDAVASPDRTLRIYDGLYHEILNEPEQAQVMADIADWLDTRL